MRGNFCFSLHQARGPSLCVHCRLPHLPETNRRWPPAIASLRRLVGSLLAGDRGESALVGRFAVRSALPGPVQTRTSASPPPGLPSPRPPERDAQPHGQAAASGQEKAALGPGGLSQETPALEAPSAGAQRLAPGDPRGSPPRHADIRGAKRDCRVRARRRPGPWHRRRFWCLTAGYVIRSRDGGDRAGTVAAAN